jgi:segregation and condensation protein B
MADIGLVQIIEGALMAAGNPLTPAQIAELFEEQERPSTTEIREALKEVSQRCEDRGFELLEVAGGFRFQVLQSLSPWVARLWQERPQKYSRAMLETLSLIAYRQPITRGEIEEIRGVAVSSSIIKTLHEREWVRVVGHRDVPGRPAMYATTRQFLDYFNLKTLDQLPALAEIRDFETLTAELGFTDVVPESAAGSEPEPESEAESEPESESSLNSAIELDAQSVGEDALDGDPQNSAVSDSESDSSLTVVGGTDHIADEGESSDETPQPTEAGI